MRATVINLDRRPDRLAQFMEWNGAKGLRFERFAAVDGSAVGKPVHLQISEGNFGCTLSHRALWQRCADDHEPLLVFEDDALISPRVGDWLPEIDRELHRVDLIHLGYNTDAGLELAWLDGQWCRITFARAEWPALAEALDYLSRDRVALPARTVWGTLAYAISPEGAARLLSIDRGDLPADVALNSCAQAGQIHRKAFFPPLAIGPNDHADSDIQRA